jgi:hypothetical protein
MNANSNDTAEKKKPREAPLAFRAAAVAVVSLSMGLSWMPFIVVILFHYIYYPVYDWQYALGWWWMLLWVFTLPILLVFHGIYQLKYKKIDRIVGYSFLLSILGMILSWTV